MVEPHYTDAGHSGSSSETGSETAIEMTTLDDDHLDSPKEEYKPLHYANDDRHSEEDSGDDEEDADTALLVPRPGWEDMSRGPEPSTWTKVKRIVIETGPTLLLTTVGLLFTGELLNSVSHWKAMAQVDELIMIIPVILNLKGNLEMNLSARLGTSANMGELDKPATRRRVILGNLTLLQVQATAVSFVAAVVAFALGRIMPQPNEAAAMLGAETNSTTATSAPAIFAARSLLHRRSPKPVKKPTHDPGGATEFILTASSAMLSACLSSILLGSFMCMLVVLCRRFGLDPDNIAPPIAACLGDLVTLTLLGIVSGVNVALVNTPVPLIMIIALTVAAIGWAVVTHRNKHVAHMLTEGWVPLFLAMIISCGTGIVLDLFVSRYDGFALLAAVISGLPGNVGAVFVSRLSTALHATMLATMPMASTESVHRAPPAHRPSPRLVLITLIFVTLPIEVAFLATLRALGWLRLPIVFLLFSLLFFCVAVVVSLFLAQGLTNVLWKRNLDPDMYALPIHSALVDLIGQLLLVLCFEIVSRLGVRVATKSGS